MKLLDITLSFLLITLSTVAFAQSKAATKATKLYKEQQFAEAIPFFEEAVVESPNYTLKSRLAYCYKVTNKLEKAENAYSVLVYDDKVKPISFRHYAETLMGSGKYAAAKFWLDEYIKEKPDDKQAKVLLQSCELVYTIKPYFEDIELNSFEFNSDFDDNAPFVVNDKLYFSSDGSGSGKTSGEGRGLMNVFSTEMLDGAWNKPQKESGKINSINSNSGPVSFTADGLTAIYCKNAPVANRSGQYSLQVYIAPVEEGKVKVGQRLSICKLETNYFQASISPDGNTIVFSANKGTGGLGGADLYQTNKTGEKWSTPKNLGEAINTTESEGFPFLTEDKLYFCSKGKLGFGGFDLYVVEKNSSGLWSEPSNLGFPINSSGDEMSIFVNNDGSTGMLSSTRNSGNDDLYFFGPKTEIAAVEKEEAKVEEEVPDFAKAAIAKEKAEKERLRIENIAKAEAAKQAAELKAKQEAEAIALAAIEREKSLKISKEELAQVETEYNLEATDREATEDSNVINELSNKAIDIETGDTIYVGEKIEEPTLVNTNVNVAKREIDKNRTNVKNDIPAKPEVANNAKEVASEMAEAKVPEVETNSQLVEAPATKVLEKPVVETSIEKEVEDVVVAAKKVKKKVKKKKVKTPKVETPKVETEIAKVDLPVVETPEVNAKIPTTEVSEAKADIVDVEKPIVPEANTAFPKTEVTEAKIDKVEIETPKVETPEVKEEIAKVITPKVKTEKVKKPRVEKPSKSKKKEVVAEVKPVVVEKPSVAIPTTPKVPSMMETGKAKMAVATLVADLQSNNTNAKSYSLADLKYGFNATEVTADLKTPLNELADVLKSNAGLKIKMIGHTGSIGSDEKNNRLSVARAAAAVDYLITKGVDPLRLSYEGKGETKIVNGCHDGVLCGRAQHAENDRIEMVVQ